MPRSVKVVKLNEQQPEMKEEVETTTKHDESEQCEQVDEINQVQSETPPEQYETKDDDLNSDDLDHLVKEYTKQRNQKKKETEPKSDCQHCGKSMSLKSLKYSHQKSCKSDPRNQPPPPQPSPPSPPPNPKPKIKPPRKTIVKQKKVELEEVPYEIQTPDPHDVKEPLTTSYIKLMELQRSTKVQQIKQRMKNLASQAF